MAYQFEKIVDNAKRFVSGLLSASRLEMDISLKEVRRSILVGVLGIMLAVIGFGWLSSALANWLNSFVAWPVATAIVGAVALLCSGATWLAFRKSSRQRAMPQQNERDVFGELTNEDFAEVSALPDSWYMDYTTKEAVRPNGQIRLRNRYQRQMKQAQQDLIAASENFRDETVQLINPVLLLETRVRANPRTFVAGGLAAGVLLGLITK